MVGLESVIKRCAVGLLREVWNIRHQRAKRAPCQAAVLWQVVSALGRCGTVWMCTTGMQGCAMTVGSRQ